MTLAQATAAEGFSFMHDALTAAQAVRVAVRLGVFARLEESPADATTVARDCAIGDRGASALLAALAGLGLAEAVGNGLYRVASGWDHLARFHALWDGLEEAIRTDQSPIAVNRPHAAQEFYPDVVPLLGDLFAPAADEAARHLASSGGRILDVGAGAAPWSIALVRHDPSGLVTALDLPGVIPATRQAVGGAGYAERFCFVEGDLFEMPWGSGLFDVVVLGNLCHLFSPVDNARLLERSFVALRPGGRVAIVDCLPFESLDGPRSVVLYALGLFLRSDAGRVYPFSAYVSWLRDAGFAGIERVDLSSQPALSLLTGRKMG